MRRLLSTLVVAFALSMSTQINAQIDILAGIGLSYSTAAKTVGIQFKGDVDITDVWGASLNLTPYFKSGSSYFEINFDAHYMFLESDPWSVYALAGLNVSTAGVGDVFGVNIPGITRVGLNLGGGARYAITDNILLYGEMKYIVSNLDGLVITVGGLYKFSL